MNIWLLGALVLVCGGLVPLALLALVTDVMSAAVAFDLAGPIVAVVMLLLAQGFDRSSFAELAVTLAVLSFGGTVVLARFLEWGV